MRDEIENLWNYASYIIETYKNLGHIKLIFIYVVQEDGIIHSIHIQKFLLVNGEDIV